MRAENTEKPRRRRACGVVSATQLGDLTRQRPQCLAHDRALRDGGVDADEERTRFAHGAHEACHVESVDALIEDAIRPSRALEHRRQRQQSEVREPLHAVLPRAARHVGAVGGGERDQMDRSGHGPDERSSRRRPSRGSTRARTRTAAPASRRRSATPSSARTGSRTSRSTHTASTRTCRRTARSAGTARRRRYGPPSG